MRRVLPSVVAVFVAVSVAWAAASYPTSVKVFTTKAQNETIQPAHMNDVQDEIVAVEQGLLNGFQHDLKPDTDGGRALGTSALRFKNLRLFLGTLTDQLAAIDIAGTWNDAADTFTAIKLNITDTASAAASLLIDLQVGGVSKFKVDKAGNVTVAGSYTGSLGTTTRHVWIHQSTFTIVTGTPVMTVINSRTPSLDFDAASSETVAWTFAVPEDYASGALTVKLHWTNRGAGSGDVVWELTIKSQADTADLSSTTGETVTANTIVAPTQNILKISTHTISVTPTAGHLMRFMVTRKGADAADTLGNDAGFVGVEIEYTANR